MGKLVSHAAGYHTHSLQVRAHGMSFTRVHSVKVNKSNRTVGICHQYWLLFYFPHQLHNFLPGPSKLCMLHSKISSGFLYLVEMKRCVNLYQFSSNHTIVAWAWAVFSTEGSRICFLGKIFGLEKRKETTQKIIAGGNCVLFRVLFIL